MLLAKFVTILEAIRLAKALLMPRYAQEAPTGSCVTWCNVISVPYLSGVH